LKTKGLALRFNGFFSPKDNTLISPQRDEMITIKSTGMTDIGRRRKGNEDALLVDDDLKLFTWWLMEWAGIGPEKSPAGSSLIRFTTP